MVAGASASSTYIPTVLTGCPCEPTVTDQARARGLAVASSVHAASGQGVKVGRAHPDAVGEMVQVWNIGVPNVLLGTAPKGVRALGAVVVG